MYIDSYVYDVNVKEMSPSEILTRGLYIFSILEDLEAIT